MPWPRTVESKGSPCRTAVCFRSSSPAPASPSTPGEPAQAPPPEGARLYATPEDFGAVGDDEGDDTDAFEKLAEVLKQDQAIVIPARRYLISRTWKLPYVQGGRITGLGGLSHHEIKLEHGLRGAGAELCWIGEDGGTMVELSGSNLIWDAVSLHGRKKAEVGFYMKKPADRKGLGTGKHAIRGLSVSGCKYGIRLSDGGSNVDSTVYEYIYTESCEVGLLIDADMAMGHYFAYFHPRSCGVAIWLRRGGALVVRGGLNTSTGTFLRIGDKDPDVGPGRNNGLVLIEGIKTDAQNKEMRWVEMLAPRQVYLTFNNCQQSWTQDGSVYARKWQLWGPATLTLRDCSNLFGLKSFTLQPAVKDKVEVYEGNPEGEGVRVSTREQKPNVLLERCHVDFGAEPKDWFEADEGHWSFRVRDCYRGNGEPLKDVDK
ncbi:MAG: glycoside hydrolase family 55 protein [Planctomycetota bacterium]|nr:glycoside hydrolase family 55 protein [Planctomycetota bacterium]